MKLCKTHFLKNTNNKYTSKGELGEATGERRMTGFHVGKGITTCDPRNLDCVWENRGERRDEGRLVLMGKIGTSAITDH